MTPLVGSDEDLTDGRGPWEWKSRYPAETHKKIKCEAVVLVIMLALALIVAGGCIGLDAQSIVLEWEDTKFTVSFQLLATFFAGCVGGVTFSMKWLIHSVAKGRWHEDRVYWRFLVPLVGGIYACVVIALWDIGLVSSQSSGATKSIATIAPLAFLVGYFSDGVSGLLSNVANAAFGTVQRK